MDCGQLVTAVAESEEKYGEGRTTVGKVQQSPDATVCALGRQSDLERTLIRSSGYLMKVCGSLLDHETTAVTLGNLDALSRVSTRWGKVCG